jgi:ATPase subunit of ABC transporter with duplicated ATPase domains
VNWIKTNWTILAALAAMSAAWGDQVRRVNNVEEAIVAQTENNRDLKATREQVIRQDEQLKAIKESQKTQEQLLRDLIQGQRSIERKVSK